MQTETVVDPSRRRINLILIKLCSMIYSIVLLTLTFYHANDAVRDQRWPVSIMVTQQGPINHFKLKKTFYIYVLLKTIFLQYYVKYKCYFEYTYD